MKQVWIPRIGGPEVMETREAADPSPGPGEVKIRVAFSGVNFADVMTRIGLYPDAPKLPLVVGYEVSGTVEATGSGVDNVAVGDRVLAMTHFGGYSSVVCTDKTLVRKIPDSMTLEKAAAIPVVYLTAWTMLVYLGNVKKGDTVLVHAAAGGVGQAALQICKHFGANVIGTASKSKHARLLELGVSHCIDYTTEDFEERVLEITKGAGVDIALDAVGGESFGKSYRCLAPLGRVYCFGASAFAPGALRSIIPIVQQFFSLPKFKPLKMMDDNRGVHGVNLGHLWDQTEKLALMLEDIGALAEKGILDPVVDTIFPAAEAGKAHDFMKDRKNFGKVLLRW
jgi:synaptic vesicle membrane protein VAT-1